MVVEPLQAGGVRLVRNVLEPSGGCVEVSEEDGEVEAEESVDLFGAPTQIEYESRLFGLTG